MRRDTRHEGTGAMLRESSLASAGVPRSVGCAKKPAKSTGPRGDDQSRGRTAVRKRRPPTKANDQRHGNAATAKPNWLDDPTVKNERISCTVDATAGGKPDWGRDPRRWRADRRAARAPARQPQQPMAAIRMRATAAPRRRPEPDGPTCKPVSEADMKEVWIFIENASGASGKMPTPELIVRGARRRRSRRPRTLVKDGSIILTGATTRESVWAYETNAPTQGGWVASAERRRDADRRRARRRLGSKQS